MEKTDASKPEEQQHGPSPATNGAMAQAVETWEDEGGTAADIRTGPAKIARQGPRKETGNLE